MELVEVFYVPKLSMNILSILEFEMDGCELVYHDGVVDLYPEGISSGTKVLLGVRMDVVQVLGGSCSGGHQWMARFRD